VKKVPIIKKGTRLDEVVSGNFKIKLEPYYIKVLSELYNREDEHSLGFVNKKEGVEEALYVARKYQDLVDVGFYPPNTQFIVARDELNVITIVSVMPEIDPAQWHPHIEKEKAMLRRKAAKVLGVNEKELSYDTTLNSNYGLLDDKIYCFDLHVMPFYKILKSGNKYREISLA